MDMYVADERTDEEQKKLKEMLSTRLENNFDSKEYAEYFFSDYPYSEEVAYSYAEKEGYPDKIDWTVLKYYPEVEKCQITFDKWADIAVNSYLKKFSEDGIKEFLDSYTHWEMYNTHHKYFTFKMNFNKTVEEYLDVKPTWGYATGLIATAFDSNEFRRYLMEEHEEFYLELIKEVAKDEGFKNETDLRKIKVSARFTLTSDGYKLKDLADASFSNYGYEQYGSASDFVDAQINRMCYDNFHQMIRHKIIILSDPNESINE